MKKITLLFSLLVLGITYGQLEEQQVKETTMGVELDALPYIADGYYASVWFGHKHFRYRGVISKLEIPDFFVEDGFTNNEVQAYAAIVDYFFKPEFEGWWLGTGLEYWDSKVQTDAELETAEYDNTVFTLGGGYVWKFHKNFYLNPWAATHIRIAGDKDVLVDGSNFETPAFTPEISVKLGWHF